MTAVVSVSLETRLKAQAFGLGFDLAGICTLGPTDTADEFEEWLAHGFAGTMDYLPRSREKRRDSRLPVPGALSAMHPAHGFLLKDVVLLGAAVAIGAEAVRAAFSGAEGR